jgi:hypothetical protein
MPAWTQPRVAPPTGLPAIAGSLVIALALPVYLITGWRFEGWALGAVLWAGSQGLGWFVTRLRAKNGNLAAAGVAGFLMLFRAIAVMVVVFAVVTTDKWLGLSIVVLYALAFSAELGLSLVVYFTGPEAGRRAVHS